MPPRSKIPRTPVILVAVILWLALSLGWSAFLITRAAHQFAENALLTKAQQLAALLPPIPPPNAPIAAGIDHAQDLLDQSALLDNHLAYVMAWSKEGIVLLHTNHTLIGTILNVNKWPALEPTHPYRIGALSVPAANPSDVLEVTLPLAPRPRPDATAPDATAPAATDSPTRTYLSLAYPCAYLAAQSWQATRPLFLFALLFSLAGAVLLVLAILHTFTRLDRSRREIEQTARARTSLLTERGMLASVLAHEVRSPLTALRFNLHSLRTLIAVLPPDSPTNLPTSSASPAPSPPDKRLELTDRCEREIHRLDGMLNDFLLRTQVLSPPEPASLNAVIREAVEFLRPALDRRNIRVSLHLDEADPHVHIHPDELRQVILNLAANAQDAMPPPKGGTLAISTIAPTPPHPPTPRTPLTTLNGDSATTPPSPTQLPLTNYQLPNSLSPQSSVLNTSSVTLLFRDSGTGIPPELLERIFEPFFSTKPNGSGLGLTLVRRVVSGAGGTLFVESTPKEGTTFRILLPPPNADTTPSQGYAHTHRGTDRGTALPGGEPPDPSKPAISDGVGQ